MENQTGGQEGGKALDLDDVFQALFQADADFKAAADHSAEESEAYDRRTALKRKVIEMARVRELEAARAPEPLAKGSNPTSSAPDRIWLNHGAEDPAEMKPEEWKSGEVTWCWHSVHGNDVEYIRADLAPLSLEGAREALRPIIMDETGFDPAECDRVSNRILRALQSGHKEGEAG